MKFLDTEIDWPLDRNIIRRGSESNTFGMVRRNADLSPRPHQGWDFFAPIGTPCYAIADGVIVYAGQAGLLGNLIVTTIGNTGKYAAYAHLAHIETKAYEQVKMGHLIGFTGSTGNADTMRGLDEHLHFEARDKPMPGLGLTDRFSPIKLFGTIPYLEPSMRIHK